MGLSCFSIPDAHQAELMATRKILSFLSCHTISCIVCTIPPVYSLYIRVFKGSQEHYLGHPVRLLREVQKVICNLFAPLLRALQVIACGLD